MLKQEMEKHVGPVLGDAFPFAGRRCERLTDAVLSRLGLA
jgi:RNA polymerase sigma-70 factor (ECF subfamily)